MKRDRGRAYAPLHLGAAAGAASQHPILLQRLKSRPDRGAAYAEYPGQLVLRREPVVFESILENRIQDRGTGSSREGSPTGRNRRLVAPRRQLADDLRLVFPNQLTVKGGSPAPYRWVHGG